MTDSFDRSGVLIWAVAGGGGRAMLLTATATQCLISYECKVFFIFIISKDEPCTLHSLVVRPTLSQAMFAIRYAYNDTPPAVCSTTPIARHHRQV